MKRWFPLVVFLMVGASVTQAESVQEVYARGVRAYSGGNADVAQKLFREVLAADPGNAPAALYLRRIASEKPKNSDLRKQMEAIIVPKVDFRDASLSTVLDYLPKVVAQQSAGRVTLNIVRMFPADYGREKLITLQLAGVPVTNVLDYVAQLANVKVEYQPHAVVISTPQTVAAQ